MDCLGFNAASGGETAPGSTTGWQSMMIAGSGSRPCSIEEGRKNRKTAMYFIKPDATSPASQNLLNVTRRHFFRECGIGVGKIALASLLTGTFAQRASAAGPLAAKATHFTPKAKRVIHLFMAGAPSQLDLFDHKPKLAELEGKPIPPSVIGGQRYAFIQPNAA